jgi:hypothetical protein
MEQRKKVKKKNSIIILCVPGKFISASHIVTSLTDSCFCLLVTSQSKLSQRQWFAIQITINLAA